eukprot:CAMPEP_0168614760 /NCGR_PEP_ID=MMETSP0449_2-20121227/4149_1 /TAXON_ID=1082188 /ORGANISM="Strombidium rassoulzadegani, Strain ras09" /LENGTH=100 /DNA_ID=CAMNT_0008655467 /DNA_START=428 /DNA_END=729 /DNA_ORIENTATION=+
MAALSIQSKSLLGGAALTPSEAPVVEHEEVDLYVLDEHFDQVHSSLDVAPRPVAEEDSPVVERLATRLDEPPVELHLVLCPEVQVDVLKSFVVGVLGLSD